MDGATADFGWPWLLLNMVRVRNTISVKLPRLARFSKLLQSDLRGTTQGPVRKAIKLWEFRYRAFIRDRFVTFSRGGGNWPPLAPATIARRRGKGSTSILIDTGSMFGSLSPSFTRKPGEISEDIPFGIRVGIGGGDIHPPSGLSLARLIRIHHLGEGVVPARTIIVAPDTITTKAMRQDMLNAIKEMKNQ